MSTHDTQGRPWARLTQLNEGDEVEVTGFTCIPDGAIRNVHHIPQGRYIVCSHGHHFLAGQTEGIDEYCVGVYKCS